MEITKDMMGVEQIKILNKAARKSIEKILTTFVTKRKLLMRDETIEKLALESSEDFYSYYVDILNEMKLDGEALVLMLESDTLRAGVASLILGKFVDELLVNVLLHTIENATKDVED